MTKMICRNDTAFPAIPASPPRIRHTTWRMADDPANVFVVVKLA